MEVESLLKRGSIHTEYCEDAVFYTSISDDWIIGSVMDGCSSAKESYFASTLFSKLISKACKTLPYLSRIQSDLSLSELSPKKLGESILSQVFDNVKKAHQQFLLDEIELLTTLLIAVVNVKTNKAWVNISGDGFIEIDNRLIELDQNNVPDYLSYHLKLSFESWLKKHTQSFELSNFKQLTITTDGISKFIDKSGGFPKDFNSANFLLSINSKNPLNLNNAFAVLAQEHQLTPFDDIGIIRFY